jgi:DNA-binding transcriptional regulator YiaG
VPVQTDLNSLGRHLRRRHLQLKIFQSEAARRMKVSNRTLSLWECDRLYPTWFYWPRIIAYLGFDPFTDSTLGRPKGNETNGVAILSTETPATIGPQIARRRMELKRTRTQFAKELGVSVKTLWGWETGRHEVSRLLNERMKDFLHT